MTLSVKHGTVAAGENSGNGEIHREEWNEDHALTGTALANLRFNVSGDAIDDVAAFIQLSDSTIQAPANTDPTLVLFDTTDESEDITYSAGTITINSNGMYAVVIGAQVGKATGAVERKVDMWLRVDDVDVPNSNVRNSITNTETQLLVLNTITRLAAGAEIKVYMGVDNTSGSVGMYVFTPSGRPVIPSVILSIYKL